MEILYVRYLSSNCEINIITACEDTDTCPGCGAGYRVGMSQCEYCSRPVQHAEEMTMGSDASIEGWGD